MIYFIGDKFEGINSCTIEDCVNYLKNIDIIGLDIETTRKYEKGKYNEEIYKAGLDPFLSKVLMLQIGDLENQYIIDCRVVDISPLKELFQDKSKVFVGANLKFEAKHLKHNYNIDLFNIWDCMLVEIILTNGLEVGYSLAKMAERYLGIQSSLENNLFNQFEEDTEFTDKSIRIQFVEWGDKPFTEKQIMYGKEDIVIPLKIMELQKKSNYLPEKCIEIENNFCMVLADIELRGIPFNSEQWLQVAKDKEIIYNSRLLKLNTYVESNHKNFCSLPDLFDPEIRCNILWSSSDQVIKYFRFLKFCPKEKSKQTKKIEFTVGAKALFKLLTTKYKELYMADTGTDIATTEDLILNYLLLKKSEQAITTFGEDFLKYLHPITGRIHSNYKQLLNTGRIASSKPNIQNIPSEIGYRKSFVPSDGYTIINADYSSQESRVLAEVCGDKDMLSFFNDGHEIFGDDYHSFIATKMFRLIRNEPELVVTKKTHPKERQDAKSINFKIAYGGSAFTLKDDFGVDEEVAQKFIDGYFEAIPTLKRDFENAKKSVLKKGYIDIDEITGRRWYWKEFSTIEDLNKKIWSFFPENYRYLSPEERKPIKEKIYKEHPEVKEMWSEYFSLRGKAERNALNYRIQGFAGSQTKMAGIMFRKYQIENNLQDKLFITNLIHDEFLAEVSLNFQEEGREIIEKCMIDGAQYFCKKVKMDAQAVLVNYWHH